MKSFQSFCIWTLATSVLTAYPAAEAGEWKSLLEGNDLGAWETSGNWMVKDNGVLVIQPRRGEEGWRRFDDYLWSKQLYANFKLDLEFKIPKGGNSGVFVRVGDRENPVETGMEVQIIDSYGKQGALGEHDLGGIIRTIGPAKNMAKPPGEWNRMIVSCWEHDMEVELNGERIIQLSLDESSMKDRPLRGYIGLQDHGLPLAFRNVRIKELDKPEWKRGDWVSLFDGDTLEGWVQHNGTATYRVEDGTIVGKTSEGSPNSFLCTKKNYSDFELEFEVKVDQGLNSGVQIRSSTKEAKRVDGKLQHAGRVYGPQVEIVSGPGHAGYIYGEATGRGWLSPDKVRHSHNHFKNGEWNHYRVRATGPHIETWINGVQIADLTDQDIFVKHHNGLIGLQVHGIRRGAGPYEVAWRNIQIKELAKKN